MIITCSTGHTGSIHVNTLVGGDTHILTLWTKAISKNRASAFGQHTTGLKM